jgi:hypothetical protein
MTTLSKMTALAALVVAATVQTGFAQTQTDEVLDLNIDLTAVSQGPASVVDGFTTDVQVTRITTRSVIEVLGTSLGQSFSHRARLVVLAPTNVLDDWTVQIQDGTNAAVDVSGFFVHVTGFPSVGGAWINNHTQQTGLVDYSDDTFMLQDQGGFPTLTQHFSVSGFTVLNSAPVVRNGAVVGQNDTISARVSGTGDNQGNQTVITG